MGNLALDPWNTTGWRHRRRGGQAKTYEELLVCVHGVGWLEDALHPAAWRKAEKEFVDKALETLQLGRALACKPHVPAQPERPLRPDAGQPTEGASPEEVLRQCVARPWSSDRGGLHFVVDSSFLADWIAGRAEVEEAAYQHPVAVIIDTLSDLAGPGWGALPSRPLRGAGGVVPQGLEPGGRPPGQVVHDQAHGLRVRVPGRLAPEGLQHPHLL